MTNETWIPPDTEPNWRDSPYTEWQSAWPGCYWTQESAYIRRCRQLGYIAPPRTREEELEAAKL